MRFKLVLRSHSGESAEIPIHLPCLGARHEYTAVVDKVVHFEIPADDLPRAKKFYSSLFGWELEDYPMPGGLTYTIARTVPVDEKTRMPREPGAINGGLMRRTSEVRSPVFAVNVRSVDEYLKNVVSAGGKVVTPKTEIGGMGYYAYVSDTEGNVLGLWEDIKK